MPGKDRDDDTGQYTTTYRDEDFLAALREHGPLATTQAIADAVGCNRDTAYRRLRALTDEDRIESEVVGNTRLWRLPDDHQKL